MTRPYPDQDTPARFLARVASAARAASFEVAFPPTGSPFGLDSGVDGRFTGTIWASRQIQLGVSWGLKCSLEKGYTNLRGAEDAHFYTFQEKDGPLY
jgi:hypothetical protein